MSSLQAHAVRVLPDPDQPGQSILVLGGPSGGDDIRLLEDRRQRGAVELRRREERRWVRTTSTDISRIDVYAGAGDDDISAHRRLSMPVRLFGGAGDDKLRGGDQADYPDRGVGDDPLYGVPSAARPRPAGPPG